SRHLASRHRRWRPSPGVSQSHPASIDSYSIAAHTFAEDRRNGGRSLSMSESAEASRAGAPSRRAEPTRPAKVPEPRAPNVAFRDVPKTWLAGSVAATHLANGVNLRFPAGERFFIRSVRRYLPELTARGEHALVAQVRG